MPAARQAAGFEPIAQDRAASELEKMEARSHGVAFRRIKATGKTDTHRPFPL
jgi:hypothetical protein